MIDCIYDYNQPLKASSWYNLKSLEEYPSENIEYIWIDERFKTKKQKTFPSKIPVLLPRG